MYHKIYVLNKIFENQKNKIPILFLNRAFN